MATSRLARLLVHVDVGTRVDLYIVVRVALMQRYLGASRSGRATNLLFRYEFHVYV